MTTHFVLAAGNIGAGKTSVTERLAKQLGWRSGYESVADNPYLADFYSNMAQWSFHLQIFFLGHRAEQHRTLATGTVSAVSDRSIYEDAYIFARVLHHLGNLTQRDFDAYRKVYDLVVSGLPKPDLLLYLKAPVPVLMERIRQRGREMESGITADYLSLLDSFYDEWMAEFDVCPVLTIHTENLNFVDDSTHLETVVSHVQDMLKGREDLVLR